MKTIKNSLKDFNQAQKAIVILLLSICFSGLLTVVIKLMLNPNAIKFATFGSF